MATDMETFDFALGLLEVVLVASSAAVLLAAARGDGRRLRVAALVLPALTAVTVAHPFGVMALERDGPPPPIARPPVDPAQAHRFSILGVPGLTAFKVYPRDIIYLSGEGDYPSDTLRVRSWVTPGLFTNSSEVAAMCGVIFRPCWRPEPNMSSERLELRGPYLNGTWALDIIPEDPSLPKKYPGAGEPHSWTLLPGVTSWTGAGFWLLTGLMWRIIYGTRRPWGLGRAPARQRPDRSRSKKVAGPRLAAVVVIPLALTVLSGASIFFRWPEHLVEGDLPWGPALAAGLTAAFYTLAPAATAILCSLRGVPARRTLILALLSGLAVPAYQVAALVALFLWLAHQTAFS